MFKHPFILFGIIVGLAIISKAWVYHSDAVADAKASIISEYNREYVSELEEQLKTTKKLLATANEHHKDLSNAKDDIARRNSELTHSLRNRPVRIKTEYVPYNSSRDLCPNTGEVLSREDAEFLTREASRADTVVAERDYYYRSYQSLKTELDNLNGKD